MSPERTFVAVFLASLLGFGGLGSLPVLRGQLSAAGLVLLLCRVPPLISVVIAIAAGLIMSR